MGFQGSMVVTRETPKDYVLLSTNQSKKLLSGGQMSCNKDTLTYWKSVDNVLKESFTQEQNHQTEMVFGKDMNEWIKEFVQNEFFRGKNDVDVVIKETESTQTTEPEEEKDDADMEDTDMNHSIIDALENECVENDEENDDFKYPANDELKSGKTKKNFKVFKFMKNAIKRHIKK